MKWGMLYMKFKTSLFNKSIFLNSIKRFGWIGLLYFTYLFFVIPIRIIYTFSSNKLEIIQDNFYYIERIFNFSSQFILLSTLIIPIFIGIMLFRYIQKKNISNIIHSLPIRRECLFITNIIFGLLLLILPVLLIALISTILFLNFGLSNHLFIVLNWLIVTLVFNIIFFSVSVFCGMITGMSTLQGILTILLLFLPYGLSTLILLNIKNLVYGFYYSNNNLEIKLFKLSPITRMILHIDTYHYGGVHRFTIQEIILYLIVSVILIITSYYLYKFRKTESATRSITFKVFKPIFKYSITFSGMLLVGLNYNEKSSFLWMILGYIIGSLLGYYISEMIIRKSFFVFKNNIKGYLIYAIVILIIFTVSISIYERYIPNEEDIETFSFSNFSFIIPEYDYYLIHLCNNISLKSEENLKILRNFHEEVIKNKKIYRYLDGTIRYVYIEYKLKNGKHIYRLYKVSDELYEKYFKPVIESIEYKKSSYNIFKYEASEIKEITFEFYKNINKHITVDNKEDFEELKVIIENEIINMKYDDIFSDKDTIRINITPENEKDIMWHPLENSITLPYKSKEMIVEWLFEKGYKR